MSKSAIVGFIPSALHASPRTPRPVCFAVGDRDLDLIDREHTRRAPVDLDDSPDVRALRVELDPVAELERTLHLDREPGPEFAFIDAERAYPVALLCSVLGVSRSGFYAWRERPPSARAKSDAPLAVEVTATHKRTRGTYGSPRVHRDLAGRGVHVGRKRVERVMREHGIVAREKRCFRKTTDSAHAQPIAPNLFARNFETSTLTVTGSTPGGYGISIGTPTVVGPALAGAVMDCAAGQAIVVSSSARCQTSSGNYELGDWSIGCGPLGVYPI